MAETPTTDRPSNEEARAVLRAILPEDRFQRRRVFLAALARMTGEGDT